MTAAQARWEITQSKDDIESRLGKEASYFAYPNGSYTNEVARIVKEAGFRAAFAVDHKWASHKCDLYRIPRVATTQDIDTLRVMLCGFWGDVQPILRPWRTWS